MAINGSTGGKSARNVGAGNFAKTMKGMAPGGVKKRSKTPGGFKGSKKKRGVGGNVTVRASGKALTTTIGNKRAKFVKSGVQRQFLGP